jgi:hypothetical protein
VTYFHRPGTIFHGALIPSSLCASNGFPCDPICEECHIDKSLATSTRTGLAS